MTKPGRPPRVGKKPADIRVTIRLTKAEAAAWARAARHCDMNLSDWIRLVCSSSVEP